MDHQTLCGNLLVNVLKRSVQQDCFQLSNEQTLIPCVQCPPIAESGRRSVRSRKVSKRISTVSLAERESARNARLDALEDDDATGEGIVGDSDEEFVIQDSDDGEGPSCSF